jgi:ankyrin repeat protein
MKLQNICLFLLLLSMFSLEAMLYKRRGGEYGSYDVVGPAEGEEVEDVGLENKGSVFDAVMKGNLVLVRQFIEENGDINKIFSQSQGWLLLHCAIFYQQLDIVALLVNNGANVNAPYSSNNTITVPLQLAVGNNDYAITKMLLEAGACPLGITYSGNNADILCLLNWFKIIWGEKGTIYEAINKQEREFESVKPAEYTQQKWYEEMNQRGDLGYTRLMRMVLLENTEAVKKLLANGANPLLKMHKGDLFEIINNMLERYQLTDEKKKNYKNILNMCAERVNNRFLSLIIKRCGFKRKLPLDIALIIIKMVTYGMSDCEAPSYFKPL